MLKSLKTQYTLIRHSIVKIGGTYCDKISFQKLWVEEATEGKGDHFANLFQKLHFYGESLNLRGTMAAYFHCLYDQVLNGRVQIASIITTAL